MTRIIKFRAWDKTHKKMLDRVLAGPGDPCSIVWQEENKRWVQFDEFCGDIMQYTGLKDSKGQEIFNGDFIKAGPVKEGRIGEPFVGRVYWNESQYQWWITDDRYDPTGIDYDLTFLNNYERFVVIGNICKGKNS